MPSRTLVSVDEYLHTSYHPDCDYVDGDIVERNVGELDHSELQGEIYAYFRSLGRKLNIRPYPPCLGAHKRRQPRSEGRHPAHPGSRNRITASRNIPGSAIASLRAWPAHRIPDSAGRPVCEFQA